MPIDQLPTGGLPGRGYLEDLASDQPTPGGGAWAAVSAAAGAAMIAMVARLTIKKKGYEEVVDRMRAIADECDDERYTLLALADRDAEAYREVMAAYKLPKASPEEQHTWSTTLQKALERAADIPLEVARRSVYLMGLAEETLTSGNPNAASDALERRDLAARGGVVRPRERGHQRDHLHRQDAAAGAQRFGQLAPRTVHSRSCAM